MGFFNSGGLFDTIQTVTHHTTGCSKCGAYLKCKNGRLDGVVGSNDVLLVLPPPSEVEDLTGSIVSMHNISNRYIKSVLYEVGISFNECSAITVVGCYKANPVKASPCCFSRLVSFIKRVKPKLILSFGADNLWSMVHTEWTDSIDGIGRWRGITIPSHFWGAWVCNVMSLDDICTKDNFKFNESIRKASSLEEKYNAIKDEPYFKTFDLFLKRDVRRAIIKSRKEVFPEVLTKKEFTKHLTPAESIMYMEEAYKYLENNADDFVTVDLETTGLAPYNKGHHIRTMGMCYKDNEAVAFEVTDTNIPTIKKFMTCKGIRYVNANVQYEWKWFKAILGITTHWCHDIIIYKHLIDQRPMITSLKFQAYVELGVPLYNESVHPYLSCKKDTVNKDTHEGEKTGNPNDINDIDNAPLDDLIYYNCLDCLFTRRIAKLQFKHYAESDVKNKEYAYEILMNGANALAYIEYNGDPIDVEYLDARIKDCNDRIKELDSKLWADPIGKKWKEVYGDEASLESVPQTIDILTNHMNLWAHGVSRKKKPSADEAFIERIKNPWVTDYIAYKKYNKILNTYLLNIKALMDENNVLHCNYTLNRAASMRSTSVLPNLQNMPSRSKMATEFVKGCFKAPEGWRFFEADQANLEVRTSCILHKDRNLISYIKDDHDFHSDTARDAFLMSEDRWDELKQWSKEKDNGMFKKCRHTGKNKCVFPFFYNSIASNIGADVWDTICYGGLMVDDKSSLKDHVMTALNMKERYTKDSTDPVFKKEYGFTDEDEYYTHYYTKHMEYVEDQFWNVRFKDYAKWKRDNYSFYLQNGYLDSPIGVRYEIIMRRTQTSNLANQGMAFMMGLLYPLYRMYCIVQEKGLEDCVRLSGQIHDSTRTYVKAGYEKPYCKTMKKLMKDALYEKFPFINVVLDSDFEASPIGGRWSEKEHFEIK